MAVRKKVAKRRAARTDHGDLPVATAVPVSLLPKIREYKVDPKKDAALREFMGKIKSADGGIVMMASDAINTYGLRRPSGIMQLDIDCAGGLPAGGLSTLVGPDGTGKSELLYLYMAQHQRIYGNDSRIALAHTEGQFDFFRAKRMGLQISIPKSVIEERRAIRIARGQPDLTAQEIEYLQFGIGKVVFIGGDSGEEVLTAVVSAVASNAFGIIAIDSLQGLIPQADADKELNEVEKRAAFATLITKFMKHYVPLTTGLRNPNYTTLIAVSQVRANPDKGTNPYAPDFIAQLARSMKHHHLIEITLTTGQQIRKTIDGKAVTTGKELKWKLTKGKAGAHDNVTGQTPLLYPEYTTHGQSVDVIGSVIVTGMKYGVVREDSKTSQAWVVRPSESDRQILDPAPNIKTLEMMMRVDPDYEQAIRQEILLAARLDCRYQ